VVGVGVKVGGATVGDDVGFGVSVGAKVGVGVGKGVEVPVGVGVKVGGGVKMAVEVGVKLGVLVAVSVEDGRGVLVGAGVGVKRVQLTHNPTRRQKLTNLHPGSLTGIGFTSIINTPMINYKVRITSSQWFSVLPAHWPPFALPGQRPKPR